MSTKQTLSLRQQKIRNVLQNEKENGNDLTKKELIDRIRQILEQDYQMSQRSKEKELRAEEIRRIRKLRMDGKITSEEEEYLTQSYQNQKPTVQEKEEENIFESFQPNPVYSHRNKDLKKTKNSNADSEQNIEKGSEGDQKEKVDEEKTTKTAEEEIVQTKEYEEGVIERKESGEEVLEEKEAEEENVKASETKTSKEENTENEDSHLFQREKSELTLALENETSLIKLYELAEKMVYVSPKK